jgi:hypothetical protein
MRPPVRWFRAARAVAARSIRSAGRWVQRLRSAHSQLLVRNAGYAAAVGAAAAAAFTQASWADVAAVVISAAVAIWTAIRNGHTHRAPTNSFLDPGQDWS